MKRDYLGIGLFALALSFHFVSFSLAQGKSPRAVLESAVYDFGTVKKGAKLSHTIFVRNEGDAPLIIEGMRFSVPMLRVGVNRVVTPEEEANIVLELDTAELSGQVLDDIVLHTNDPQASQLSIRLQGRVQSPVEVLPRPAIYLSAFRWETGTKTGVVTVANNEESPLEILGNRAEGDRFSAALTPIEEGRRYQLTVKLVPAAPAGHASGTITLNTNKGDIQIPVFTFLKDKVYVNPPDVELGVIDLELLKQEPRHLDFRSQSVFVYKHQGQDFRIRVDSSLPFIAIEKTPPEGPGALVDIPRQGPTGIFELRVFPVKEQLKPGKFQGTIRVSTNDGEFRELLIPVRVEVR